MSKSPILVGVSGIKGSGKSYLCSALQDYSDNVDLYSNIFSFAEPLKEFCIKVLGLTDEQCYGKDKETFTKYQWHFLPDYWEQIKVREDLNEKRPRDLMTARQVMQEWARIFRSMNEDIFVDRMKEKIEGYKRYNLDVVFVDDLRHTNEVKIFDVLVRIKGNTEKKDHGEFELEDTKFHLYVEPKQAVESSKIIMSYVKDKYFGDNQ